MKDSYNHADLKYSNQSIKLLASQLYNQVMQFEVQRKSWSFVSRH